MMMGVIHMSLVLILWPIINFSWNSVMSVFPSYSGDAHAYLPGVCVQVAESQTPGDSCKALSFLGFFHRYSMLYLHLYFYEVKCLFFKYSMDHLWINTATSSWKNWTDIFHKCLVGAVDPSIHPNISVASTYQRGPDIYSIRRPWHHETCSFRL